MSSSRVLRDSIVAVDVSSEDASKIKENSVTGEKSNGSIKGPQIKLTTSAVEDGAEAGKTSADECPKFVKLNSTDVTAQRLGPAINEEELPEPTTNQPLATNSQISELTMEKARSLVLGELLQLCEGDGEKRKLLEELSARLPGTVGAPVDETTSGIPKKAQTTETDKIKWADVQSMAEIVNSPYEIGANAEVGLDAFETFKTMMVPDQAPGFSGRRSGRNIRPSSKAVEVLGKELATAMVMASNQISLSGITYSSDWIDGVFRDVYCGEIPKPMLLLCLQEQRFSRAEPNVLSVIIEHLGISNIVKEAMDDWEIEDEYPNLANCKLLPFHYKRNRRTESQKCEIFVARAYACMNALHLQHIPTDTTTKVLACLKLMEENLVGVTNEGIDGYPQQIEIAIQSPTRNDNDDNSVSSKKSVRPGVAFEKMDLMTGKVIATYESIDQVLECIGKAKYSICNILAGRTKSSAGFFWRKVESNDLPQQSNDKVIRRVERGVVPRTPTPVEKLSLRTGRVLEEFSSARHAIAAMGATGKGIYECLHGRKEEYLGYFWRVKGSTRTPLTYVVDDRSPTSPGIRRIKRLRSGGSEPGDALVDSGEEDKKIYSKRPSGEPFATSSKRLRSESGHWERPVEKVCLETGRVLEIFATPEDCARALGKDSTVDIYDVLEGRRRNLGGFIWRYEGTESGADRLNETERKVVIPSVDRSVEKLSLNTGQLLGRFESARAAQMALGRNEGKGVERVCEGLQPSYKGWFWRWAGSLNVPKIRKGKGKTSPGKKAKAAVESELWALAKSKVPFNGLPYSEQSNYELNEAIFERLSALLKPGNGQSRQVAPSPEARVAFGEQALALVLATHQVRMSSIAFGSDWHEGTIRDVKCGKIPDSKLLLCLKVERFASAEREVLAAIVNDLSLHRVIVDALHGWGLEDYYPHVAQDLTKPLSIQLSTEIFQCYIFVARVRLCIEAIGYDYVGDTLMSKVRSCLDVIDGGIKRRSSVQSEKPRVTNATLGAATLRSSPLDPVLSSTVASPATPDTEVKTNPPENIPGGYDVPQRTRQTTMNSDETGDSRVNLQTIPAIEPTLAPPHQDVVNSEGVSMMKVVVESPYEEESNAEVGEEMFQSFESLLSSNEAGDNMEAEIPEGAARAFGESLANSMINAHAGIVASGMVYYSEWKDGKVAGEQVGFIPKPTLLLLLQGQRFSKSNIEGMLVRIIVDLSVCSIVRDALGEWGLKEKYPKAAKVNSYALFASHKVQCYKCLIFIARAFRCMKSLKRKSVSQSIMDKVNGCLSILEAHIEQSVLASHADEPSCEGSGSLNGSELLGMEPYERSHRNDDAKNTARSFIQVLPVTSLQSTVAADTLWFPLDPEETILNETEIETAWLAEESIFCLRNREIQWSFVWKYASPSLKVELRKIGDDGNQLEHLVRLRDRMVSTRFAVVRREIRKKLHRGFLRAKMHSVIPKLRHTSRPATAKQSG